MSDLNQYKGRKGRKRLAEINEKIRELRETDPLYMQCGEMESLLNMADDPIDQWYFLESFRHLDSLWSGTENYGLLRLCVKWVRIKKLDKLTRDDVDLMMRDILPSKELEALGKAMSGFGVL